MNVVSRPTFSEVYERTGPVHHNGSMPKGERIEALTKELVESGFLKDREYKSIEFGNHSLYAFEIGEKYADILILHAKEALLDPEFAEGYVKLMDALGNKGLGAPAWDFPQEVIDNILKENKYIGQLEV